MLSEIHPLEIIPNQLERTELQLLAELREVYQTVNSAGWQRIQKLMESQVAEAHEDMLGAVFATAEVKAAYLTRWQQREAMCRGILDYIAQCDRERKRILEEIEEREKQRTNPYESSRIETA